MLSAFAGLLNSAVAVPAIGIPTGLMVIAGITAIIALCSDNAAHFIVKMSLATLQSPRLFAKLLVAGAKSCAPLLRAMIQLPSMLITNIQAVMARWKHSVTRREMMLALGYNYNRTSQTYGIPA